MNKTKILIIRLSSIGDVLQCISVLGGLKKNFPNSEIHWVVRSDIAPILKIDPRVNKIWSFDKKSGLKGLKQMTKALKRENFTHVYDAHSNIRSNIIKLGVCPFWKRWLKTAPKFAMRSKERIKRILLFKFRINHFPKPFRGMVSYQAPLAKWKITNFEAPVPIWIFPPETKEKVYDLLKVPLKDCICLVPSAAWEMKRWPISYWKILIEQMPQQQFVIIGGPHDTFCEEIASVAPERTTNLAGKTNLLDSCFVVHESCLTISADTGFIHAADLFEKKGIFLVGPTAFGFPTGTHISIMEREQMACRPCSKDGRGKCSQKIYKQCLVDISPKEVAQKALKLLS